jgi:hypothetical protein
VKAFRSLAIIGALCAASSAMAAQLTPSSTQLAAIEERERAAKPKPYRKRVHRGLAQTSPKWKRSRGAQAKPKRRANRLTISKRVRRKHRRAAR